MFLLSINLYSQDAFETNLRVSTSKDSDEKTLFLYDYTITLDSVNNINFKCLNCRHSFKISLEDIEAVEVDDNFTLEIWSTTEEDYLAFLYDGEQLKTITIIQSNGVEITYLNTEITPQKKSYKL